MDKIRFFSKWFQKFLKKTSLFSKYWYLSIYWLKATFSMWPQNNVITFVSLIFADLWTKNVFFKEISKNVPRNVDSYGNMYKKPFFQSVSKNHCFCRYINVFGYMSKKRFLKVISKNGIFLKILMYLDIWTKKMFQRYLKKFHKH